MTVHSLSWNGASGWSRRPGTVAAGADLVLYFGATDVLARASGPVPELAAAFPSATVCGCSTAGEISGGAVSDDSLAALVIDFAKTSVRAARAVITRAADSRAVAADLARQLAAPDLAHVLVLSDGLSVNGTQLTAGFRDVIDARVAVSGGLAGDGAAFKRTLVGLGADVAPHCVVALGFYGAALRVDCGSAGGWQPFGPKRLVTRAEGNVLHELDGQPALALYKKYLGDRAAGLPATGLLFPLEIFSDARATQGLVRTILAVDEAAQSLTFAGDVPTGCYAQLMRCTHDRLVAGAAAAATAVRTAAAAPEARWDFALLVSCVGRKLVLGQRVEDEVEAVRTILGEPVPTLGFYSYGEICPAQAGRGCELHNQTMTLTAFTEAA